MATILFIEDESVLQETLGNYLRESGHVVVSALDGDQGLRLLRETPPDIVLLDLILPHVSGLEVLESIRRDPMLEHIPVIVLTNVESNESVEKAMALGAAAYLIKTNYALEEVGAKVNAVLDRGKKHT